MIVVLDSLRYDSWLAAPPRSLAQLGDVERRWSYASWTAPSHYNLLMGLMPHASPSDHVQVAPAKYNMPPLGTVGFGWG